MKIKNVLRLHGKNMAGFWSKSFGVIDSMTKIPEPFVGFCLIPVILILVLTPVLSLIFPIFKTIFDMCTRKEVNTEQLNKAIKNIDELSSSSTDELVTTLHSHYQGKSNSSKKVLKDLKAAPEDTQKTIEQKVDIEVEKERKALLTQQKVIASAVFNKTAEHCNVSSFQLDVKLTTEQEQQLVTMRTQRLEQAEIPLAKTNAMKGLLRNYLINEMNHGKRLEHLIVDNLTKLNSTSSAA